MGVLKPAQVKQVRKDKLRSHNFLLTWWQLQLPRFKGGGESFCGDFVSEVIFQF